MIFYVEPYVGAKPLDFGMNKCEINHILGDAKKTFRRNKFATGDTEMYSECFVEYDENEKCTSIEFFGSACLMLKGVNLFALSCAELRTFLNVEGDIGSEYDSGFVSNSYGISVYAPDEIEDSQCSPESISVFEQM